MVAFLAACDDSSSASVENNEPTTLSSAEEQGSSSSSSFTSAGSVTLSSSSRHCEECNDEAISSSIEELNGTSSSSSEKEKSQSSSSEKSGKSSSSVIDVSSSSVKSESTEKSSSSEKLPETSSSSEKQPESSSSSLGGIEFSSSSVILSSSDVSIPSSNSVVLATPCKNETEDNCEYGELSDERGGRTYKTVKIDNQWWMAENLNYESANSWCGGGRTIANGVERITTEGDCAVYGRLYTWTAATTACPSGWHLPSKAEWETLFTAVGGQSTASNVLKSTSGWYVARNGTDVYGFSALPAGGKSDWGYYNKGDDAYFWSSTEDNRYSAYYTALYYDSDKGFDNAKFINNAKDYAFSVRCLKD